MDGTEEGEARGKNKNFISNFDGQTRKSCISRVTEIKRDKKKNPQQRNVGETRREKVTVDQEERQA